MKIHANLFLKQRDKLILQMKEKTINGEEKNDVLYNGPQEEKFR